MATFQDIRGQIELKVRDAYAPTPVCFDNVDEFARLYHRDGKSRYLADIPLTLEHLFAALDVAIHTRLSERQRTAVLAELHGLPTVEIAARLETNQNALYKLVHDARKKLRTALQDQGFDAEALSAGARSEVVR